jgi:hypothetical protein
MHLMLCCFSSGAGSPLAAMLLDVMSWFITKEIFSFAYDVIFGGALMGISMGLQILLRYLSDVVLFQERR